MTQTLDPEDNKIITLARSARARGGTPEGAAVRDETGRTYAATTVALPSLRLSALQAAVAMAVSSGAKALEAAAIVTEADDPAEQDLAVIEDMGNGTLFLAAPDGSLKGRYI
ncbi:cytidine deaminase [Microbispora siamensis]|uniref:cytidine deaminase n=1 Tax=Microbispora sp. H10830 TaxID=2729109 RepID=UPI001602B57B|nr:cytidine deaminase [Microbispora sp. H10830]